MNLETILIERAQAGSVDAFDELWRRYEPVCFAFARRLCHDEDMAGDVLSETALRAFRGIRTYEGRGRLTTWLYRIVANAFHDMVRLPADLQLGDFEEERTANIVDTAPTADQLLCEEEIATIIGASINRLPAPHAYVLREFYYRDRSLVEISTDLRIPHGTAKTRVFRGRALLKQILENESLLSR